MREEEPMYVAKRRLGSGLLETTCSDPITPVMSHIEQVYAFHDYLGEVSSYYDLAPFLDHEITICALNPQEQSPKKIQRMALFSCIFGAGFNNVASLLASTSEPKIADQHKLRALEDALDAYLSMEGPLWDSFMRTGASWSTYDASVLAEDIGVAVDVLSHSPLNDNLLQHFPQGEFVSPMELVQHHIISVLGNFIAKGILFLGKTPTERQSWHRPKALLSGIRSEFTGEEFHRVQSTCAQLGESNEEAQRLLALVSESMAEEFHSLTWKRFGEFTSLAQAYNVEWALAAMEWKQDDDELG